MRSFFILNWIRDCPLWTVGLASEVSSSITAAPSCLLVVVKVRFQL
jgi:hypothetical protein